MLTALKTMFHARLTYFNDNEIDLRIMADDISAKTGIDVETVDMVLFEETKWMLEKGFSKN